jgi:hypothetical protein
MHNVVMNIPSIPGTEPDQFVFASLVACLPGLIQADHQRIGRAVDGVFRILCSLVFPSEVEVRFALSSMEWVDLIDETADTLDWDAMQWTSPVG